MKEYIEVRPLQVIPVEISDYTNTMIDCWVASRPDFLSTESFYVLNKNTNERIPKEDYIDELLKMDVGLNYFAHITLRICSSLLLREYFYTFQDYYGKWALTNRYSTKDPDHLTASSELYNSEFDDRYYSIFREATIKYNNGEIQNFDHVREYMPLSYQTVWQISLPIKVLIRILGQMFHDFGQCKFTQDVYLAFYRIEELRPWLSLIGKYSEYDNLGIESKPVTEYNLQSHRIGMVLYSQLIRHEGIFVSGIKQFIIQTLKGENRVSKNFINIQLGVHPERWKQILKLRTSWFAVTDDWGNPNTWSYFLQKVIKGNLNEDAPYLKYFNSEGKFIPESTHDYHLDDDLRVHKGYNAYLPDAFALESRDIVLQRIERYGDNPLLQDYLQMFDSHLVKDNPDNPMRKKWESLCMKK